MPQEFEDRSKKEGHTQEGCEEEMEGAPRREQPNEQLIKLVTKVGSRKRWKCDCMMLILMWEMCCIKSTL